VENPFSSRMEFKTMKIAAFSEAGETNDQWKQKGRRALIRLLDIGCAVHLQQA
jgi:hypothetical protein